MQTNPTVSPEDRERIIEEHLPLVRYVVRKMHVVNPPAGLDFDDLVSHGTLGLIQAVDGFDGSQGVQFSSFAITRIRGAVLDALRSLDPVGRPTRTLAKRLDATQNALALELGREPTWEEVQRAARVTPAEYWRARSAASMSVVPIEQPSEDEHGWEERLADETATVSAGLEQRDMAECLSRAVAELPERERLILSLYYVENLTLKDIARALDISETRVSQLLHRAYARLRVNPALAGAA